MRKSTNITNSVFAIAGYYGFLAFSVWVLGENFPGLFSQLPFGGIDDLIERYDDEIIATIIEPPTVPIGRATTLAVAIFGAVLVTTPVTWVYFITTRTKKIDRSFAQTIMVLPVVVAGIAVIVQHSLPLAFSLAGVVAAVRFRFALEEPAHALYIFAAIAIGLGAGVSALGIAYVISLGFVSITILLWKLDYGANLTTPFFSFLTGRGRDDNDL